MYDIIAGIIQHTWDTDYYASQEMQITYYICGALIIVFTIVFVDLVYRVFSHFWNGRK